MNATQITPIEPGNRIQLPADWAEALGLHGRVALDKTSEGILVRPAGSATWGATTWDDIFATKLTIGSAPPDQNDDSAEVTGDDFLF